AGEPARPIARAAGRRAVDGVDLGIGEPERMAERAAEPRKIAAIARPGRQESELQGALVGGIEAAGQRMAEEDRSTVRTVRPRPPGGELFEELAERGDLLARDVPAEPIRRAREEMSGRIIGEGEIEEIRDGPQERVRRRLEAVLREAVNGGMGGE